MARKVTEKQIQKVIAKTEKAKKNIESYLAKNFADTVEKVTIGTNNNFWGDDLPPQFDLVVHFHRALTNVERNFLPVKSQGIRVEGAFPAEEPGWKVMIGGTAGLEI